MSFQGFDGSVLGPPPDLEPEPLLVTGHLNGRISNQIPPLTSEHTITAD